MYALSLDTRGKESRVIYGRRDLIIASCLISYLSIPFSATDSYTDIKMVSGAVA